jgi:hypothetical protein
VKRAFGINAFIGVRSDIIALGQDKIRDSFFLTSLANPPSSFAIESPLP